MQDHRRLEVWELAHRLTVEAYEAVRTFPRHEQHALAAQLRRAAASVPIHIAGSCGLSADRERARHLQVAFACACEAEYHVLLATELGYFAPARGAALNRDVARLKRMLGALIRYLRHHPPRRVRDGGTGGSKASRA